MRYFMKLALGSAVLVCVLSLMSVSGYAYTGTLQIPQEGVKQVITLEDGSSLVGKITMITKDMIKFECNLGEIDIELAKIKSIEEIPEVKPAKEEIKPVEEEVRPVEEEVKPVEKEVIQTEKEVRHADVDAPEPAVSNVKALDWFPNPNRTRLLLGPTARTLKAGNGYLYDLWIFFPGAAYGISDNFMISAGASLIPDADEQMFYIIPKLGFPATEQLDLAASLMIFRLWDETFYFGMGSATVGTDDASLTGGIGIAFKDDEMADKPVAMLGGEYRTSRRMSLVGEGWFVPGDDDGMLGFGGVRLMGEQMTVDLGFALSYENRSDEVDYWGDPEEDEVDWLPYIDFVWNF